MVATLQFQYSQSLPWVILLVVAFSILTLLVYPAQLKQLPRLVRWLPPTLRILAITAIALSILRPVVTRARIASERAPILILIDDSRSMSVVDSNRPPGEWVGIAAAMGRLPANARDRQIAAVQADCDRLATEADEVGRARDQLDYARLSGRGVEAAQARLEQTITALETTAHAASDKALGNKRMAQLERTLAYLVRIPAGMDKENWLDHIREKSRTAAGDSEQVRMNSDGQLYQSDANIRDACLPLQSLSRLQISEAAVFDPDNGLLTRLGSDTSVRVFGISSQAAPINLANHTAEPLNAEGAFSNLTGQIRSVLEGLKASPPRAVLLFSDGRQVNADTDAAVMSAITAVPIFTVGICARSGLKDLSITSATVNATAGVGETVIFKAELRGIGMNGASTDVTFSNNGIEETRRVTFSNDQPIPLTYSVIARQPGLLRLGLDIAGLPGEGSYENNHVERWVTVSSATTRPITATKPATRPAAEAEMIDLSSDESFLRRLCESSSGQFFRLDQVDLLPRRLAEIRDDVSHPIEVPLWDGPYLFVLVLGCLAGEWGLRKRYGLA